MFEFFSDIVKNLRGTLKKSFKSRFFLFSEFQYKNLKRDSSRVWALRFYGSTRGLRVMVCKKLVVDVKNVEPQFQNSKNAQIDAFS